MYNYKKENECLYIDNVTCDSEICDSNCIYHPRCRLEIINEECPVDWTKQITISEIINEKKQQKK